MRARSLPRPPSPTAAAAQTITSVVVALLFAVLLMLVLPAGPAAQTSVRFDDVRAGHLARVSAERCVLPPELPTEPETALRSPFGTWLATVRRTDGADDLQSAVLPAGRPVSFSAVRVTKGPEPHAYGTQLDLFKHEGAWAGFVSEYTGSVADPPVGRLDNLRLDEKSGRLTFTAKLSLGATLSADTRNYAPTKDLYEFTGTVDRDAVAGTLVKTRVGDVAGQAVSANIILKRKSSDGSASEVSYEQWLTKWTEVFNARGPRW